MTAGPNVLLILFIFLGAGWAGCLSEPAEPPEAAGPEVRTMYNALIRPIRFAGTTNGSLDLYIQTFESCPFDPYPAISYKLFDRLGLVAFEALPADPRAEWNRYKIPVQGEPPFLLAGDFHGCAHPASRIENVTDGFDITNEGGYDLVPGGQRDLESERLTLEPGQKKVSLSWPLDTYVWNLVGGGMVVDEHGPPFAGAVRLLYPDGSLWSEQGLGGGADSWFEPLLYLPGNYTVEFEADFVAARPVTVHYWLHAWVFGPDVCRFGFEWEICR